MHTSRLRVFVASSSEKLRLAEAVHTNLDRFAEVTVWTHAFGKPSEYPLEVLERAAANSDAGVFILAPDDVARMRGQDARVARDNVLFELGMFIGAMGRKRSFIVVPRRRGKLHLPSDLTGLGLLDYDE